MIDTHTPKLDAPIVLVHGLCGYDRIVAFGRTLKDYFPGIREKLEAAATASSFRASVARSASNRAPRS